MSSTPLLPLVLGSASPRRHELLSLLGLRFSVHPADIDESSRPREDPEALVVRLARTKSLRCQAALPDSLILAADTIVTIDSEGGPQLLGKPRDPSEAKEMLRRLSGNEHRVCTGVALARPNTTPVHDFAVTRVTFAPIPEDWLDWYVSTDEPYDKAGGYAVQGRAALFVSGLSGSWSNVVGLPMERLPALFQSAGQDLVAYLHEGTNPPGL